MKMYKFGNKCTLNSTVGLPGGSMVKNLPASLEDPGLIPRLGRSPGEGKGYPLQYSVLENSVDYSPWDCKQSDTTERLSLHFI